MEEKTTNGSNSSQRRQVLFQTMPSSRTRRSTSSWFVWGGQPKEEKILEFLDGSGMPLRAYSSPRLTRKLILCLKKSKNFFPIRTRVAGWFSAKGQRW